MVTRRSTHANHAKPSVASKRLAHRRTASTGKSPSSRGASNGSRGGHVGNVGGYGTPAAGSGFNRTSRAAAARSSSHNPRPSTRGGNAGEGVRVPTPNGGEILLTRRHFLFGALGVGALAAVGAGATVVTKQLQNDSDELTVLEVPKSAVTTQADFTIVEDENTRLTLIGNFELPYGTLVWANDEKVAACLLPTEEASPLTQVGLLSLDSGNCPVVLKGAAGLDEGFEIYDVRATAQGLIWTEANILDGIWRVYTASLDGAEVGTPALVEEGGADWETPTIAAVGAHAFWQVLPKPKGEKSKEDSLFKRARMGSSDSDVLYTSHGRMATPPYGLKDSVVITPRTDTSSIHYQLTHIDAATGDVLDSLALPQSMRPLEAGYGTTGFSFSFEAWYNYGEGISKIGTYTPAGPVADSNYSGSPWFCFDRAPSAAPAWCGRYFIVKGDTNVHGIDLDTRERFTITIKSGADKYGEYLASTGVHNSVVTFTNINDKPLDGDPKKYCLVRVWQPAS